jgi:hypothetical protein
LNRESIPFKLDSESKDHILETSGHYDSHRSEINPINSAVGENHYLFNNSSTSSSLGLAQINKMDLPYVEAIKCIEKI